MSMVFGLYLGCTSSCVAFYENGQCQVINNNHGDKITPACVRYDSFEILVGIGAKQNLLSYLSNTILNVKRILGKNFVENADDLQDYISKSSVKVIENDNQPVFEVVRDNKVTHIQPIEVAELIFKELLVSAKNRAGQQNCYESVLTVPIYFNSAQREAIKKAAEDAGFKVLRVINECTSSLLAYSIGQNDTNLSCNVLVVRVGGQSTDISVVKVVNGMYTVVAYQHEILGGNTIDDALVEFHIEEFKNKRRLDCSKNERSRIRLRIALESCKRALTAGNHADCLVDSLFGDADFKSQISRDRINLLCNSFIKSLDWIVTQTITDKAGMSFDDIDKVVLSGGVTRMPYVQQKLRDLLPRSEFCCSIPPDDVIAIGAAYQAAILTGRDDTEPELFSQSPDLSCLSSNIVLELTEGRRKILFQKKTPVPFRKEFKFPVAPGQEGIMLHLMQGNDSDLTSLLKVVIGESISGEILNVVFHFKYDGSLHIVCSDSSGKNLADFNVGSKAPASRQDSDLFYPPDSTSVSRKF